MSAAANRYAKALFAVAKEKGAIEAYGEQLDAAAEALQDKEVRAFFDLPNVETETKVRVLQTAVGSRVSEPVANALKLLVERGRAGEIGAVSEAYRKLADEALGRAKAHVTAAQPLTPEQEKKLAETFGALTGKKITVETTVDASLLGGIRVRIGDMLYDASLSTRLMELEKSLYQAR